MWESLSVCILVRSVVANDLKRVRFGVALVPLRLSGVVITSGNFRSLGAVWLRLEGGIQKAYKHFSACTNTMQMFYFPQLKLDRIGFTWAFFLPQKHIVSEQKHWANFSVKSATVVSKNANYFFWILLWTVGKFCVRDCCYDYLFIILRYGNKKKKCYLYLWLRCYDPHVDKCVAVHEACVLHSCDNALTPRTLPTAFSVESGDDSDAQAVQSKHLLPPRSLMVSPPHCTGDTRSRKQQKMVQHDS